MPIPVPPIILELRELAHPSWRTILLRGLEAIAIGDSAYLPTLATDDYLPTAGRMFAAFAQPLDDVRYVLVGEGPYPRTQSATGVCFMDGAVGSLWSEVGLSKQVNRATSLRNFIKMLLVAERCLAIDKTNGDALAHVSLKARAIGSPFIQTLAALQTNLTERGFLLLNAALVFRPHVPPSKEARAWQPFLQIVLNALVNRSASKAGTLPTMVLWGRIAEQLRGLPESEHFPKAIAEHPYNLSFIGNPAMRELFEPMHLLKR
jgi:uracil-DNA glycosylase